MSPLNDFAVFILSHGRPDKVITYDTLRRCGYTGPIYIIVDNLDKTVNEYVENFGDKVIVFDKPEIAKTFDRGDNFNDYRSTSYVRNAMWDIANDLGLRHFIQLDDDYGCFRWRFNNHFQYLNSTPQVKNLDALFSCCKKFISSTNVDTLCLSQGGDFIGGESNVNASNIKASRKAMNSFFCDVKKPFYMLGRLNEDVNYYLVAGSKGNICLTTNQCDIGQAQTQGNFGGMTDVYLDSGTYVKSFYSVMYQPSSVKVSKMSGRLHHSIDWKRTVPKILRESLKK